MLPRTITKGIAATTLRRTVAFVLALAQMLVLFFGAISPEPALADTASYCATGTTSSGTISGVLNTYYPPKSSGTLASGSTTVNIGTINASGASTTFSPGDLALIIQMQDGSSMNDANSTSYGTGNTTAGTYEYTVIKTVSGSTLTLSQGLVHSYYQNTSEGQSYEIVRVPRYSTATFSSSTPPAPAAWNGSSGGILALDVAGTLNLNGATIAASALGFRGGLGISMSGSSSGANTDYLTSDTNQANGEKGEGIGGTPANLYNSTSGIANTGLTDTLPGGKSFAKGAALNAGGGGSDNDPPGNDENTGGGGGGNGGAGGQGGWNWSPIYPTLYSTSTPTGVNETVNADGTTGTGGVGGHAFSPAINSIVMGGGGGAGVRNNSTAYDSSGGSGGAIVLIQAGTISGSGTINDNGGSGVTPQNDGGGGGGAGGTVVVLANSGISGLTINANGAAGTPANLGSTSGAHGPGGGGGGGVIITSSSPASANITGGINGTTETTSGSTISYGAASGSAGASLSGSVGGPDGAAPGALCTYGTLLGPYGVPGATGNYTGGTADTMHDFTLASVACTNGPATSSSSFLCTMPATGVAFVNSVENTGTASDTYNLTASGTSTGWTVTFYAASGCSGGGSTYPTCTKGSAITTIAVAAGSTANFYTILTTSTQQSPYTLVGTTITATSQASGDYNATFDGLYPGGALILGKGSSGLVTNCPSVSSGTEPANGGTSGICPGGTLLYVITYQNVAPSWFAAGSSALGTEPAFAANAVNLSNVAITEDGAATCSSGCPTYTNNWATTTFGLNAAPVDSTFGTSTTYTYYNGTAFASGTYPNMTAGYTKFKATLNAASNPSVKPGVSGAITFNVTVK